MSTADDLTGILTTLVKADDEIGFRSGKVTAWNITNGENTIVIAGTAIQNVPMLSRGEALAIQVGDVVGILRVKSQYFVMGQIQVNPGEIIVRDADGSIAVIIRRTSGGGGEVATIHPNGVTHAVFGQLWNAGTGEIVGQGFLVQQSNENDLIGAGPVVPGGREIVRIGDVNGIRAFATDDGAAGLLDRPFLEQPMYPISSAGVWTVTSSTFGTVAFGRYWHTHPYLRVHVRCWTNGSTSGQVRVMLNGSQVGSTVAIANSLSAQILDFGNVLLTGLTPYNFYPLEIDARSITNGETSVCIPYGVTKRGTP